MIEEWNSKVIANNDVKSSDVHRIVVVDELPETRDDDTLYLVPEA